MPSARGACGKRSPSRGWAAAKLGRTDHPPSDGTHDFEKMLKSVLANRQEPGHGVRCRQTDDIEYGFERTNVPPSIVAQPAPSPPERIGGILLFPLFRSLTTPCRPFILLPEERAARLVHPFTRKVPTHALRFSALWHVRRPFPPLGGFGCACGLSAGDDWCAVAVCFGQGLESAIPLHEPRLRLPKRRAMLERLLLFFGP